MRRRISFFLFIMTVLMVSAACNLSGILPGSGPTETPLVVPSATPKPPKPTPIPPSATPTSLPVINFSTKNFVEESAAPVYKLTAAYPQADSPGLPAVDHLNAAIQQRIDAVLASFRKDFKEIPPDPSMPTGGSFVDITSEIRYNQDGLVSIRFIISWYAAGAAHPNLNYGVLNYWVVADRLLAPPDLFKPGTDYLTLISNLCSTDLQNRGLLDFPEGAKPDPANYQNLNLTPDGLLVSFDPYQVMAYAMGPQEVKIPYQSLKNVVDISSPIAPLAK